jgi:hypothetical protein
MQVLILLGYQPLAQFMQGEVDNEHCRRM